jgi:general stress protein 26
MAEQDRQFEQIARTIEDLRVAMMTTAEGDGRLQSRPMAVMRVDDDGTLWFFTRDGSHKLEHLNSINLAFADRDDSDYLSISGDGEVVRDRATIAALWSAAAKPWFPDGPDDPDLVALRVRPASIEYWDAPSSRMRRLVAMARAVVTGTRVDLGEHGHVRPPG